MFKSKLYWRVIANFALLLVILTAMTVLTLNILSQIQGSYTEAAVDTRVLTNLQRLNGILTDVPEAATMYALTGGAFARSTYESGWKDLDAVMAELRKDVQDSLLHRSLGEIRTLFFTWMERVGDRKILLAEQTSNRELFTAQLRALAEEEEQGLFLARARDLQKEIRQRFVNNQFRRIDHAGNLSRDVGRFIGMVNILLAIFAVALGFVLTRSITKPIQLLKFGTKGMMEGRFEPITLNRTDELGDLASDFNQMATMLGNNYTRLNAYSELVTALNTFVDIEDVENKSLELLCQHAGASMGALYLLNPETRMLELSAGYALRRG
ncbi:MAG: HAMP domain-containing protein, partial [Bacteroidota bacterium]